MARGLALLGSSSLAGSLLGTGLIDEVRIMVNPVVLGSGRPAFATASGRTTLRLLQTRRFGSGNVLLTYQPCP